MSVSEALMLMIGFGGFILALLTFVQGMIDQKDK